MFDKSEEKKKHAQACSMLSMFDFDAFPSLCFWRLLQITIQNLEKIIICSLSVLCSPGLVLTRSPQISGQNKSEAREPEGLVKITYGIVTSSLFKRVGNSN